jgi:hypothetical protein
MLTAMIVAQRIISPITGARIPTPSTASLRLPSVLHYRTSTAMPAKIINETVISVSEVFRTSLPLELSLWVIVGLVVIVAICYAVYKFWPRPPKVLQVYVEIGNNETYMLIEWIKLPHAPDWYQFEVIKEIAAISIKRHCGFGYQMLLNFRNLVIRDKIVKYAVKTPDVIRLNGWTAFHVKRLIKKPYYLIVAVFDDENSRVHSQLIRPLDPVVGGRDCSQWNAAYVSNEIGQKAEGEPKCSLYPVLTGLTDTQCV